MRRGHWVLWERVHVDAWMTRSLCVVCSLVESPSAGGKPWIWSMRLGITKEACIAACSARRRLH
jgi:hypothetical protein